MAINRERLTEILARLKQERDELRLKIHLGTMEAKEEWGELEEKLQTLESRLSEAKDDAMEKAGDVRSNVQFVADELQAAYRRIRDGLPMD